MSAAGTPAPKVDTLHAPLRRILTGCAFLAESVAQHERLPDGAAWAVQDLAQHLTQALGLLAGVEARLADDA